MATATLEPTATDEEAVEETVQQKKNRLRNDAERRVLNKHRDELNEVTEALFKAEGIPYTRRLTEKEKAKKKIEDLLNEHPDLREEYAA
jgi:hypothetical protein